MSPTETLIPLSVLAARLEKQRDRLKALHIAEPWWSLRRRWILASAAATYDVELDALLELGGATVLNRLKALNEF
jgi:hypothetical protein